MVVMAEQEQAAPAETKPKWRGYFEETRDLLTSIVLVLPLFVAYQIGVLSTGGVRNGVDFVTDVLFLVTGESLTNYLLVNAGFLVVLLVMVVVLRKRGTFRPKVWPKLLLESTVYAVFFGAGVRLLASAVGLDIVSGNPEQGHAALEPDWFELVGTLDREHCPHRSQQSIDEQIAETDALDRGQRIHARWEGFSIARRIPGFSEENIIDDSDVDDLIIEEIGWGVDWGEIVGNTIHYLVGWNGSAVYVLGEWSPSDRMTEAEECRALRKELLLAWGVDFDQVTVARGDSNSAVRRGIATSVNELMNRAVARELGRSRSPCPLRPPYKGPGSVKARARILSSACIEGRLYVHQDCQRLIHTFRHWMGENNDLKHPFDAAGYICEHCLSPVTRSGAPYTLVR